MENKTENKITDMPDRLKEWDEFSEEMRNYIGTFTGPKYGDPTLNVPVPTFIAIWNMIKCSIRCWKGCSKRHDIFKITHYCCFAWINNNKSPQAPNKNPMLIENKLESGLCASLSDAQVIIRKNTI